MEYDPRGMNHRDSNHSLSTMVMTVVLVFGVWILWYSPALVRRGGEWAEMYSWCVERSMDSKTVGDFFSTRAYCAEWASHALHKSR
jgi:hypothetical protein